MPPVANDDWKPARSADAETLYQSRAPSFALLPLTSFHSRGTLTESTPLSSSTVVKPPEFELVPPPNTPVSVTLSSLPFTCPVSSASLDGRYTSTSIVPSTPWVSSTLQ